MIVGSWIGAPTAGRRKSFRPPGQEVNVKPDTTAIILEPQDLDVLQACFDEVRRERGLIKDDVAATIAAQMIELYQTGIRDPRELSQRVML